MTLEGVKSSTIKFNVLCVFEFHSLEICWLSVLAYLELSLFVWSMLAREEGLLIPAQILTSLGTAAILTSTVFNDASGMHIASVNLISLGLGWILMPIVSWLALKKDMRWGYIPGGAKKTGLIE